MVVSGNFFYESEGPQENAYILGTFEPWWRINPVELIKDQNPVNITVVESVTRLVDSGRAARKFAHRCVCWNSVSLSKLSDNPSIVVLKANGKPNLKYNDINV